MFAINEFCKSFRILFKIFPNIANMAELEIISGMIWLESKF